MVAHRAHVSRHGKPGSFAHRVAPTRSEEAALAPTATFAVVRPQPHDEFAPPIQRAVPAPREPRTPGVVQAHLFPEHNQPTIVQGYLAGTEPPGFGP